MDSKEKGSNRDAFILVHTHTCTWLSYALVHVSNASHSVPLCVYL